MHERYRITRKALIFLLLVTVLIVGGVSQATAQDEPTLIACAMPTNAIAGQGGLSVSALGGLSVSALGGLSVSALGTEAGSLALSVSALTAYSPSGQALSVSALGGLSVSALEVLQAEIEAYPYDYHWLNQRLFDPTAILTSGYHFGTEPVGIVVMDAFGDQTLHGEHVYEITHDMINLPALDQGLGIPSLSSAVSAPIYIVPIDLSDAEGSFVINDDPVRGMGVATKLENAVNTLVGMGVNRIVATGSWGFVPCDDTIQMGDKVVDWHIEDYFNYISEHFVLPSCESVGVLADEVVSYNPGLKKDGTAIEVENSNPNMALGVPEEAKEQDGGYVSLGFGGDLTLKLARPSSRNDGCPYLSIYETTNGNPDPTANPEKARVWVSADQVNWVELTPVEGKFMDIEFANYEIPANAPSPFRYVKIMDASDPDHSEFPSQSNGYDVDGIVGYLDRNINEITVFDYLQQVYGLTYEEAVEVVRELLFPSGPDPDGSELLALYQHYLDLSAGPGDFAFVPMHSSGNYRLLYPGVDPEHPFNTPVLPLHPARDSLAIGATLGNNTTQFAVFSQDANVGCPGAWYITANGFALAGTSFSAPVCAAYMAAWLSYENPDACDFTTDTPDVGRVPLRANQTDFNNRTVGIDTTPFKCDPPAPPPPPPPPPPPVPTCNGETATIYVNNDGYVVGGPDDGDVYNGTLRGTRDNDILVGTSGDDNIRGDRGDDIICGGDGNDRLWGEDGNDLVNGQLGADYINGGKGDDELYGFSIDTPDAADPALLPSSSNSGCPSSDGGPKCYNDTIRGGQGNDYVNAGDGPDNLKGNSEDATSETGKDTVLGGAGDDDIFGGKGDDNLSGGAGNDFIRGENDNDLIHGDAGNDYIDGGNGDLDMMYGDEGNDVITDLDGNNGAYGGPGDDTITVRLGSHWNSRSSTYDALSGGYGNDTVGLDLRTGVTMTINITGDEYDDPPSSEEGDADYLDLSGESISASSTIIKFELGDTP